MPQTADKTEALVEVPFPPGAPKPHEIAQWAIWLQSTTVKADLNDYQEANDGGLPLMGRQRFCAKGCSFHSGMLWVVYIPLRLSAASAGKVICRLDILEDHPPSGPSKRR